jgi:CheY-like chemotaxis protein
MMTQNLSAESTLGIQAIDWPGSPVQAKVPAATTASPRILVIDDDPLFCKMMKRTAGDNRLSVTVCKSVGEVLGLTQHLPYDVAIVDYFFGELTAVQLVDLLGKDVPIILISGTERAKLTNEMFPISFNRFVHKNRGPITIYCEALSAIGWKNRAVTVGRVSLEMESRRLWWSKFQIWSGVLTAAFAWMLAFLLLGV